MERFKMTDMTYSNEKEEIKTDSHKYRHNIICLTNLIEMLPGKPAFKFKKTYPCREKQIRLQYGNVPFYGLVDNIRFITSNCPDTEGLLVETNPCHNELQV